MWPKLKCMCKKEAPTSSLNLACCSGAVIWNTEEHSHPTAYYIMCCIMEEQVFVVSCLLN